MEQKLIYKTTKDLLLRTPLPEETRTYKPFTHKQVIDLTLEGLLKAGLELDKEMYASAKDGNVANGKFLIKNVYDTEMQLQIVWQNSYDKSKTLTFGVGAMVLVCSNGMVGFRSVSSFRKKHVGQIQEFAPHMIPEYIKGAHEMFLELQKDRDVMKNMEIDRRTTAELIGRMYLENQFIESTQLNIIKRELKKPTYDYGSSHSLWELYQFTTFAIGGIHPSRWMEDHIDAHRFFCDVAGLIIPKKEPVQLTLYDEYEKAEQGTQLLELEG